MATNTAQLGQLANLNSQYQPYPYSGNANYADQYPSASLPHGQVQNFVQSPPPGGSDANQRAFRAPRYGDRTVARTSGRRGKQEAARGPVVANRNGSPVVPLYSYPTVRNGTTVQVPALCQTV
ncbi:uncharacterized protein LOC119104412 [Pollicipes pollicipes]|uniref:uncharacterized protein LOC119104412 n=1 Tax=Pollicipes pollicipes TaxID=41117 RepID=UPI001884B030|nr:uncharacterized protein LOC119104412 [Pollicipes pollicipes]